MLLAASLVLTSGLGVLALRDGRPAALVAEEGHGPVTPQALRCGPGEPIVSDHSDFMDLPGGHLAPDRVMEEWLAQNADGISLDDVVRAAPRGSNPGYAVYEYRTDDDATIARFNLNLVGDSWHVTDWDGCSHQTQVLLPLDG